MGDELEVVGPVAQTAVLIVTVAIYAVQARTQLGIALYKHNSGLGAAMALPLDQLVQRGIEIGTTEFLALQHSPLQLPALANRLASHALNPGPHR